MSEGEPKKRYPLTPEQLALAEERRLTKAAHKAARKEKEKHEVEERSRIFSRDWLSIDPPVPGNVAVKIMTWNLLAQCLVRRELFPTSTCLKASEREHMMYREILSHQAHICCLQEVDRTEKLFPVLEKAGYSHVYAVGPRKKHGCLIAFKKDMFNLLSQKLIAYDDQEVRRSSGAVNIHGSSFRTKNIGNLVALCRTDKPMDGLLVATTHLFWHPSYTYERTRQAAILLREVVKFREELGKEDWPCIIAGDFNFAPDDPAYSLLVGNGILPEQSKRLASSRVVHVSIDPNVPVTTSKMMGDDEEGGETDPDRIITNARAAVEADGLLTDDELANLFKSSGTVLSTYDRGLRSCENIQNFTCGTRLRISASRLGGYEPVWTSYTHYWKTVLDYIFVLEPGERPITVHGLAKPIQTIHLEPGLPQKGICGSDHISLCAELSWKETLDTTS